MIIEKKSFASQDFMFEKAGVKMPVKIGYETYGTLNEKKDNCVLICHFFTGTSHAAGKYTPEDLLPGWWDAIVGHGKIIDTSKYFVLCSDSLSNINSNNPWVITTGPASINPATGKEYAMSFPIFTLKDVVRLQRELIHSLGIEKIRMVIGPSMGGLQALAWGRYFPEEVERIIAVASVPFITAYNIMVPNQLGIEAIMLDPLWKGGNYYGGEPPNRGLLLAFKVLLMGTRTQQWAEASFGRKLADPSFKEFENPCSSFSGKFLVEREVENIVLGRMQFFDANSYIYIAKTNTLYDLREGDESLEQALEKITPRTRIIIDDSDLLFTRPQAELARKLMPRCETFYYNSGNGHLSCIYETEHFGASVREFLGS